MKKTTHFFIFSFTGVYLLLGLQINANGAELPNTTFLLTNTSSLNTSSIKTTLTSTNEFVPPSLPSSSVLENTSEKTKSILHQITKTIDQYLVKQKVLLQKKLISTTNTDPIPLLENSAKQIESKTSWLKIPRDKIPSFLHIQIWILEILLYILRSWWLLLIILLALLRILWKLWRYLKKND